MSPRDDRRTWQRQADSLGFSVEEAAVFIAARERGASFLDASDAVGAVAPSAAAPVTAPRLDVRRMMTERGFPMPSAGVATATPASLVVESWGAFRDRVADDVPMLVERIWPAGGMGFIGAAPKAGKTWAALLLSLAVASGERFLGEFPVPRRRPVLYVAMEGTRPGLRARIGALARGMGLDPDGNGLDGLTVSYKPAGLNLSDPAWATQLIERAHELDAGLVVVDVLRRAASVAEDGKGATEFAALLRNLAPLEAEGRALVFCHHFAKPGETQKGRKAADRMAGSGALFGALDAGLFITSNDGARTMQIEVETRDIAAPRPFQVALTGSASGPNGGWAYTDTVRALADLSEIPSETDVMVVQLVAILEETPDIGQDAMAARLGASRHQKVFQNALALARERVGERGVCVGPKGPHTQPATGADAGGVE